MAEDERAAIAAELRRIRETAHEEELRARGAAELLPPPRPLPHGEP